MKKNESLFLVFHILSIATYIVGWVKDIEIPLIYTIAISFSWLACAFSIFGDSYKQLKEIKQINKEYSSDNPELKDLIPGDIIEIQYGYGLEKATVLRNYPDKSMIYLESNAFLYNKKVFTYADYNFKLYSFIKHKS